MKMIELHQVCDKSIILVNTDMILGLEPVARSCGMADYTEVDCIGDCCYHVTETIDQIKKAIGFTIIKCDSSNSPLYKEKGKAKKSLTAPNKRRFKKGHYTATGFRTDY